MVFNENGRRAYSDTKLILIGQCEPLLGQWILPLAVTEPPDQASLHDYNQHLMYHQ